VGIYPRSELGPIPRMIDGLQLGTIEAYIGPADFYVGVDPRFGVLSTPMLFKNNDHASATVLDPELNEYLLGLGEPKGLVGLGTFGLGASNYAAKSPILRLADFSERSCVSTPPQWSARRCAGSAPPPCRCR
jgi:TRAP-type C4-dicarboxylate transport system substrate-binding protein